MAGTLALNTAVVSWSVNWRTMFSFSASPIGEAATRQAAEVDVQVVTLVEHSGVVLSQALPGVSRQPLAWLASKVRLVQVSVYDSFEAVLRTWLPSVLDGSPSKSRLAVMA